MNEQPESLDATAYALAKNEERIELFKTAAARFADLEAAKEQVKILEREYTFAYNAASKIGWSRKDLRGFGLKEPTYSRTRRVKSTVPSDTSPSIEIEDDTNLTIEQ